MKMRQHRTSQCVHVSVAAGEWDFQQVNRIFFFLQWSRPFICEARDLNFASD